jgi:RNA polymerase sigma factor (sigma-70 family)
MTHAPTTRASLLVRLRDARDDEAWRQFVRLYAPLVYQFARRKGLQDADAADLTQDVLRSVSGAIGRLDYDPERGSFRGWLFTLAFRRLHDFRLRHNRQEQASGQDATHLLLAQHPDRGEEDRWNQDHQQRLFAWAADEVRGQVSDNAWQAFWQTAVDGKSAKEVGAALSMTVAAVYLAKSRVMARLKELIQQWQAEEE